MYTVSNDDTIILGGQDIRTVDIQTVYILDRDDTIPEPGDTIIVRLDSGEEIEADYDAIDLDTWDIISTILNPE